MTVVKFETNIEVVNSILVKDCVPGSIYKLVAGYHDADLPDPEDRGMMTIACRGEDGYIQLQEIGGKDYITNQYWKVEEIKNVTISY